MRGAAKSKPEFPFDFQNTRFLPLTDLSVKSRPGYFEAGIAELMKGAEIFHSTGTDFDLTYVMLNGCLVDWPLATLRRCYRNGF